MKWLRQAANKGDANAMNHLGVACRSGRGALPLDDAESVKWFRLAGDKGHGAALFNLGVMYETGRGIGGDADAAEAAQCYRAAWAKGEVEVCFVGRT